jgi:hypothetical protein
LSCCRNCCSGACIVASSIARSSFLPGIDASWSRRLAIEDDLPIDETGLDRRASRSLFLAEGLDDLRRGARILVAPGDAGHAREVLREVLRPRVLLDRVLDERVLDDAVLDAALAELVAELGHLRR